MNKQERTILIWILAVSGMLLILLYSPLGSPDIYNKREYFAENQGVNFRDINICKEYIHVGAINANVGSLRKITNAPKNGRVGNSQNVELNVEDNYSKRKLISASSHGYPESNLKSSSVFSYNYSSNIKSSAANSTATSSSGGGGGGSASGQSSVAFASNNINGSVNVSPILFGGKNSMNVDLTLFNDSTSNIQVMDTAQKSGTDEGEPLPIPEGWGFLLALASIYICIKRKLFVRLVR
jgi:hypothetical protein